MRRAGEGANEIENSLKIVNKWHLFEHDWMRTGVYECLWVRGSGQTHSCELQNHRLYFDRIVLIIMALLGIAFSVMM